MLTHHLVASSFILLFLLASLRRLLPGLFPLTVSVLFTDPCRRLDNPMERTAIQIGIECRKLRWFLGHGYAGTR
jgi:hypothetical protein